MRTTFDVDETLLEQVKAMTGEKNQSKAVSKALREFLRHAAVENLLGMAGKIDLVDNWYDLRHMDPR